MTTASTTASQTMVSCSKVCSSSAKRKDTRVNYIGGISSFGEWKAENQISCLGLPFCTQMAFAVVPDSPKTKGRRGGGTLSSTCNAASEIFRMAAIMNGLILIGVAVGFILLRVEASLEGG